MDLAVLDHTAEHLGAPALVGLTLLGTHVEQVGHLAGPQHGGVVHIEGEASRSAVASNLLGDPHVVGVTCAHPAVLLRDAQGQKTPLTQVVEVSPRELGIEVGHDRTRVEDRAEVCDDLDHVVARQAGVGLADRTCGACR